MAGRELLKKGLIWRVGNGKFINIWEDSWLNCNYLNRFLSPIRFLPSKSKVFALTINQAPKWNVDLIRRIFSTEEVDAIIGIPLNRVNKEDKLVWQYSLHSI